MNLEQRVKELEQQYAIVCAKRFKIVEEENALYKALQGAKALLDFENLSDGKAPAGPTSPPPVVEKETKTASVLQSISRRNGVTSQDLHQSLTRAGIKLTRQHLYNTLARLKEDGRIEKRGEQYFVIS